MNPQSTLIMGSGEPRPIQATLPELVPGALVDGKYRIVRLMAQGGMGSVYEAQNERIRKRVALKVLQPERGEASAVERFEREAQASGVIGSQHIVEVFDLGVLPTGEHYMVMEYLEGETLRARLSRGRLTPAQAYPVARQVLDALVFAHRAGIVHRDLKPENIHLAPGPQGIPGAGRLASGDTAGVEVVKLLDFGISKFTGSGSAEGFSITRTGVLMGTPSYMSPEQARGAKSLDARADIYALGVILYECLTGRVPFSGASFTEILFQIATSEAIPVEVAAPDVDARLAGIVRTAMARDPVARYPSAEQMAAALDAWAGHGPAATTVRREEREPPTAHIVPAYSAVPTAPSAYAPAVNPRAAALDATVNVGPGATPPAAAFSTLASNTGLLESADPALAARRGVPLGAIAALVALLLVLGGGGVAAAMLLSGRGKAAEAEAPAGTTAPAAPTATAAAATTGAPAATAAEPASSAAAPAATAEAAPTAKPTADPGPTPPAPTSTTAGSTAARKPASTATTAAAGTGASATTAPAPRKGEPPAPAGLKVNQGRLVRTDL